MRPAIAGLTHRPKADRPAGSGWIVLIAIVALIYALATAFGTIATIVSRFIGPTVSVTVPVEQFWPKVIPGVTIDQGPTATVSGGGFTLANLDVTGLTLDARLWFAAGDLIQGSTFVLIAASVAILCRRLLAGNPFQTTAIRSVALAATAVVSGGLSWQLCFGIGGLIASGQLLRVTAWSGSAAGSPDRMPETGWPAPASGVLLAMWPIWVGLALFAVVACLRYGQRVQTEREELRADTRGLV